MESGMIGLWFGLILLLAKGEREMEIGQITTFQVKKFVF